MDDLAMTPQNALRGSLVVLGIASAAYLTGACSPDVKIIEDYYLTDLGGSNQAISNIEGTVYVHDVTSYSLSGSKIIVEYGGVYDSSGRASGGGCRYAAIDTKRNTVRYLKTIDPDYHSAVDHVRRNGKSFVTRSCLAEKRR